MRGNLFKRIADENAENKIRDAGRYLAENSEPYYVVNVAYSTISGKIQELNADPELVAADPNLLSDYQKVFDIQKSIVEAVLRLEKMEEEAQKKRDGRVE